MSVTHYQFQNFCGMGELKPLSSRILTGETFPALLSGQQHRYSAQDRLHTGTLSAAFGVLP